MSVPANTVEFTGHFDVDTQLIRDRVKSLSPKRMDELGLPMYQLGMRAAFGQTRSPSEIDQLALDCFRHCAYSQYTFDARMQGLQLTNGAATPSSTIASAPFLSGWDDVPLEAMHESGHGFIVCNFHYDAHRFVPLDLSAVGERVCFPVAGNSKEKYEALLPDFILKRLRFISVEEHNIGFVIARALRNGEVVIINTDANHGVDGRSGDQNRTVVDFLGRPLSAKSGIARLASTFDVPILPLVGHTSEYGVPDRVEALTPVRPEKGEEKATMQHLYDQLAACIQDDPTRWAYARYMHNWWHDDPTWTSPEAEPGDVAAALEDGSAFTRDDRTVTAVDTGEQTVWVNARTFQSVAAPDWYPTLLSELSDASVDQSWIETASADGPSTQHFVQILTQLYNAGHLTLQSNEASPSRVLAAAST